MSVHPLQLTCKPETEQVEIEAYVMAVYFIARWLEEQDGARGKTTVELFDEFKVHVCDAMRGRSINDGWD